MVYGAGSLYVTSRTLHRIYKVDLPGGKVTEFAGSGVAGTVDGTNSTAQIRSPNGIARNREGSALFINEFGGVVRRIDLDLDAPKKPKGLRAANVTATSADLSWKDRDRLEEAFVVELREGRAAWVPVQTLPWNTTSTSVTGLKPGTRYQFRVVGRNGTSESKPSNKARATTPS